VKETVLLRTVDQVDGEALRQFLTRFFGSTKAEFLDRHGSWWHRGQENRMVLTVDGEIAGYCAVIPTLCQVGDRRIPAVWWMDLVIAPEFRGRRLQSLLDVEVRRRAELLLGFPNELAARIHLKHGWGVRENLTALVAPLDPKGLNVVKRSQGIRGVVLRGGATLASPIAALWRKSLVRGSSSHSEACRQEDGPKASQLADIAALGSGSRTDTTTTITTIRDEAYLRWRYLESPFRDQLRVVTVGPEDAPRVAAVLRLLPPEMRGGARLLDLFGDLADAPRVTTVARRCLALAAEAGAHQVTALAAHGPLASCLRRAGFLLKAKARFCWWSDDPEIMRKIGAESHHWALGDSDNDEPR